MRIKTQVEVHNCTLKIGGNTLYIKDGIIELPISMNYLDCCRIVNTSLHNIGLEEIMSIEDNYDCKSYGVLGMNLSKLERNGVYSKDKVFISESYKNNDNGLGYFEILCEVVE